MITFGHRMEWSDFNGTKSTVNVEKCSSTQEALREVIQCAKALGWTPPKWWQWWRWGEPVRTD